MECCRSVKWAISIRQKYVWLDDMGEDNESAWIVYRRDVLYRYVHVSATNYIILRVNIRRYRLIDMLLQFQFHFQFHLHFQFFSVSESIMVFLFTVVLASPGHQNWVHTI